MKIVFKNSRFKIAIFSIIVFLLTVRIEYFSYLSSYITRIQNMGCVILVITFALILYIKNYIVIKHIVYLFAAMIAVILVSTIANSGNLSGCVNAFSPMLVVGLMLETHQKNKNDIFTILDTWKILLIVYVLMDILTELRYPNGMYQSRLYTMNWLLGYKTQRYILVYPMMVIYAYMQIKKRGKIGASFILIAFLGLLDCYFAEATGCMVSILIFIVLFILFSLMTKSNHKNVNKFVYSIMNYKVFFIVYAIAYVTIVLIQNLSGLSEILSFLDKNSTFSGRTIIWTNIFNVIINNIFMGVGYLNSGDFVRITGMASGTNAHNMILQIMVFGGVLAFVIYTVMAVKSMRRNNAMYSEEEMLLVAGVYSLFILGLTSATMVFSTFGLLTFWLLEYENVCVQRCS